VYNCPFFFFQMLLHVKLIHRNLAAVMEIRAHVVASGLVQGVGFRYFVFHRASRFGLVGYVRNVFSGEVEIELEGDRSLIEEFIKEVKVGPRAAQVKDLTVEWLTCEKSFSRFEIR
jgi:acylphosphatase